MKNYVLSLVLIIGVFALIMVGTNSVSETAGDEGADILRDAIRRATVQCYAIEGAYPVSVDYLVENYGIQIDEEKYHVFYEGFASNVMPDITVIQEDTNHEEE